MDNDLDLLDPDDADESRPSLVEAIFDRPDNVSQGEYWAIYEFLLDPDIRNDPHRIAGVLREFAGWGRHMLEMMHEAGLIDGAETRDGGDD